MIRYAALLFAAATITIPSRVLAGPADCRGAIPANEGISVNGRSGDKFEVVRVSQLIADFANGNTLPFAYVYGTRGAGLFVVDSENRWILPVATIGVADLRKAYASLIAYNPPVSAGSQAVFNGVARMSIAQCATKR